MKILSRFILLISGFFLLAACQTAVLQSPLQQLPSLAESGDAPPKLNKEEIALGKTVYDQNCAACHGVELEGQLEWKLQNEDGTFKAPPHSADGHTWHHADSLLIEAVQLGGARFADVDVGGTSLMPAYADILSDEEITAVLTYIKSTWPKDIRQTQWEVTVMSSQQQ